jgi:hypothetical protein
MLAEMNISSLLLHDLPVKLWQIFYFVVFPMLLLSGLGWVIQRKLGLEMRTLTRLNFYFVMPCMIYVSVVSSSITVGEVGTVALFTAAFMVVLALVTLAVAALRRVPADQRNVMLMTTIFYNSGNYGLPLQKLAFASTSFGDAGMALQVFVIIVQNISNFTIGVFLAASGRKDRHWKENLLHIIKFPPIYILVAAFATVEIRSWLGDASPAVADAVKPFWTVLVYVKDAFVAVALCTLGAQLALVSHARKSYPVKFSVILRLVAGPLLGLAVIYALDLRGFIAQVLLISTAMPTALNVMLLCLEFENHPDYAARSVFYSTLLSPITVTLVILLAQGGFLEQLTIR